MLPYSISAAGFARALQLLPGVSNNLYARVEQADAQMEAKIEALTGMPTLNNFFAYQLQKMAEQEASRAASGSAEPLFVQQFNQEMALLEVPGPDFFNQAFERINIQV